MQVWPAWQAHLQSLSHHDPDHVYDPGHEHEEDWTTDPTYCRDGVRLYRFDREGFLLPLGSFHSRFIDLVLQPLCLVLGHRVCREPDLGLLTQGVTGEEMEVVDALRVVQPPYAPELNPVERFFRELRRAIKGRVYPDLQAKQAALEPILQAWQADPERVRQLCGWAWIRKALTKLPANTQVIQA